MDAELVAWGARVRGCGDSQLMAELSQLARRDRRCEVRMLMCLAEVDERKLFLELGFSCLFRYATAVLRMSEQQAYLRIQAARLAKQFPVVLEMLADGAVSLSTLKLLDQHLTRENHLAVLERARNKSKVEVMSLVAELAPQADVPSTMRKLPARLGRSRDAGAAQVPPPAASLASRVESFGLFAAARVDAAQSNEPTAVAFDVSVPSAAQNAGAACVSVADSAEVSRPAAVAFTVDARRASCTPLQPGRFKLQLTASQALHDKLRQLQHLLQHQVPGGDLAEIVERACDVLLEQKLKQRFAQVSKPKTSSAAARSCNDFTEHSAADRPAARAPITNRKRKGAGTPRSQTSSRYVPRAVVRAVFARDGGRCTFVGASGQRCAERGMLEVHHVHAFALGGDATVENLRLVCRSHNRFFAERDFGAAAAHRHS